MSSFARTVAVYVELSRLSNAPTVITNVLVGSAIGLLGTQDRLDITAVMLTILAILMLYCGGMALNDLADHRVDAVERPMRPLPSGSASRIGVLGFILVLMIVGLALLAFVSWLAMGLGVALCSCIIAYDLLHKTHGWTTALMGLCRGFVYLIGAAAVTDAIDGRIAGAFFVAITVYIVVLTLIAQRETTVSTGTRRWFATLLPLIVVVPILVVRQGDTMWITIAGLCMLLWIVRGIAAVFRDPPRIKTAVLTWLAGICLIDAFYLMLLDQPTWALIAAGCFIVTVLGHRVILGT